ncbi:MAG: hypothetical protein J6U92_06585 [Clostridia bacterium]|nr:hypothetical protein [Clostridia bacterium]
MIKSATRNFLIKILIVVLAVACVFGLSSLNKEPITVLCDLETAEQIKDSYMLGESFDLPDGEIVNGSDRHEAEEVMIIFPNGIASKATEQTLSQKGEYTLVYTANVGGQRLTAEKKFSVVDAYYAFTGEGAKNSSYKLVDDFAMAPDQGLSGVNVSLGKNTSFVVNQVFDATELTKQTPVVTIYPYNNTFLMNKGHGYIEAFDIQVVLTDYYDPTNYIILEYHWLDNFPNYTGENIATQEKAPDMHYMVSTKGSAFPTYYGTSANMRRPDVWKNVDGELLDHPVTSYRIDGEEVANKLYTGNALPEGATYDHSYGFSVYFDYSTFTAYGDRMNQTSKAISHVSIANLGSTEKYGSKAFTGFTEGKFTLSIKADDYKPITGLADSELACNLEISNILGRTGADLKPDAMPKDDNAPYIYIEGAGNKVIVAKGEEVKIPAVDVKDVDLKSVISQVYYGYGTNQETLVTIVDGKFTANRVGNYTVLYTAVDAFGNVATKTIDIEAKIFPNNQSLSLEVEQVESAQAGKILELPSYTLVGESVDKFVKVFYAYNDGEFVEITDTQSFFVEHVGKYTIRYEYYNLLSTYELKYDFNSVASTEVSFVQATMPRYYVQGSTYTLENYKAFRYTTADPVEVEPSVYVSEDGKAFVEIDAKEYTVAAKESVQFKYVLDGAEELSEVIPVLVLQDEEGSYLLGKHFVTSDFTYVENLDNIAFVPKKLDGNYMEFANPISYGNFFLELRPVIGYDKFGSINITLTDYYNPENVVTIYYGKQIVNAGKPNEFAGLNIKVNGQMQVNYQTHYEGTTAQFYCKNGRIYIDKFIFNIGDIISNDKVILGIEVNDVEDLEHAKIEIGKINNLVLGMPSSDFIKPQLSYKQTAALYQDLNSEVTIYPAVATDLLTGYVQGNLKMWVEGPSKSTPTALDGTLLNKSIDPTKEYTFKLTREGRYKINYEYTDTNGNKTTAGYNVYTGDFVEPTITLNGGYNENTVVKVKLGTEYTVQSYTVADVGTPIEELYVSVLVKTPAGYFIKLKDGKITLNAKGTYLIYYHCMDATTNTASTYYTVEVE